MSTQPTVVSLSPYNLIFNYTFGQCFSNFFLHEGLENLILGFGAPRFSFELNTLLRKCLPKAATHSSTKELRSTSQVQNAPPILKRLFVLLNHNKK